MILAARITCLVGAMLAFLLIALIIAARADDVDEIRAECEAQMTDAHDTPAERRAAIARCMEEQTPKPAVTRWRPWQQIWQCNDIRLTITSRTEGLIEYDIGGSIWGGSQFAVDFRRRLGS